LVGVNDTMISCPTILSDSCVVTFGLVAINQIRRILYYFFKLHVYLPTYVHILVGGMYLSEVRHFL
jgi:hypothetical protein